MEETYFRDQVAVVTGAGGTLCSEIAADLASRGARVVLIGRTEEKLRAVADRILSAGGRCMICRGDVTDEAAMTAVESEVFRKWGVCRFLVNGAGGNNIRAMTGNSAYEPSDISGSADERPHGFFDLDMAAFDDVLRINTIGTVIVCRVFGRRMAEGGDPELCFDEQLPSAFPCSGVCDEQSCRGEFHAVAGGISCTGGNPGERGCAGILCERTQPEISLYTGRRTFRARRECDASLSDGQIRRGSGFDGMHPLAPG